MPSMRWTQTLTGLSSTNGFPLYIPDTMVRPFNVGVGCVITSTAAAPTYNVEHTFDYTGSSTFISTAATWFINTGFSSVGVNTNGNYSAPVSAIRLNATLGSSVQTIVMTIIQAG